MRAHFFDAAGNHIVIGELRSPGIAPDEAFGILSGAQRIAFADHATDGYCVLQQEQGMLRARFWNSKGWREDLCANALRCVPDVVADRGEPPARVPVHTAAGWATAVRLGSGIGGVELSIADCSVRERSADELIVGAGTPHRVRFVDDLDEPGLADLGRRWAAAEPRVAATFVQRDGAVLRVRSFRRGESQEVGSSGSAALAAFLALAHRGPGDPPAYCEVKFPAERRLRLRFDRERGVVVLYGPCRREFVCDLVTDGERQASGI